MAGAAGAGGAGTVACGSGASGRAGFRAGQTDAQRRSQTRSWPEQWSVQACFSSQSAPPQQARPSYPLTRGSATDCGTPQQGLNHGLPGMESGRISGCPDVLVKLLSMAEEFDDQESLRARSEQVIGELAQALLDSQMLENALAAAFGAREKAAEAQQAAMAALNLPSAGDVERLERRLRSFSQRLEDVEDQLDRVGREVSQVRRELGAGESGSKSEKPKPNPQLEVESTPRRPRPARRFAPTRGPPRAMASEPPAASVDDQNRRGGDPEGWRPGPGRRPSACRRRRPRRRPLAGRRHESKLATDAGPAAVAERRGAGRRSGRGRASTASPADSPKADARPPRGDRRARPAISSPAGARRRADAGPDPDRAAHAELGEVGEHERRARAAHPGRLDRQLVAAAAVRPE